MQRIRTHIVTFLFAVLLATVTGTVHAQTRDEVERELAKTEEALTRARKQLGDRQCERGLALFERAQDVQNLARNAFADGIVGSRRLAVTRTLRARRLVTEAVQVCQVELQAADELQVLYESAREEIRQLRSLVSPNDTPEKQRLLEAAVRQLEQAEEAYRSEDYALAARHLDYARKLIDRARQAFDDDTTPDTDPEAASREVERTEEVLAELRSESLSGAQLKLLEQAVSIQERARGALREGRLIQAVEFTLAARRSAGGLLRDRRTGGEGTRVARAIEVVGQSLTELAPEIRSSGDEAALRLLDEATEALDRSREQFNLGKLVPAARHARRAGSLLRRAVEAAGVR